jgi:hypothetical protein
MDGYSEVFNHAITKFKVIDKKENLFRSFRKNHAIYGFIDNGDTCPDMEADSIARKINLKLYSEYKDSLRFRKLIGYGDSIPMYGDYTNLDSRHIMMFVILFTHIKEPIQNVVEIGGGFGNWLTLNQHISNWTIIDLPHVGELQKWCLDQQEIDSSNYTLISAFDYDTWASKNTLHDLVIGSHSLSEFSLEIFVNYFEKVVCKAKYFFYAYHNTRPTPQLINEKLKIISTQFDIVVNTQSERGNVSNSLCIHKQWKL